MVVNIVGAGISGLSAAVVLSRAGKKVNVVERANCIGGSKGQDFQVIRNYGTDLGFLDSLSEFGIDIKYKHPVNKIIKFSPSGRAMEVNSDNGPLFYVVKRGKANISLDSQIYHSIDKNFASFEFNRNASVMSGDIISTGPIIRNIVGFGYTFEGIDIDSDKIYFFMNNKYAPKGYIYVSPFDDGTASVAAVSYDLNCNLKILLDRFLEENKLMQRALSGVTSSETFNGFAYCNYPESAQINNKLFVGAAAGFVEAARGFGVKYSILSGILAAKSIIENKDYDVLWKDCFGNELKESLKRNFLLNKLDNSGFEKLLSGEKVSIKNYEKIPKALSTLFEEISFSNELKKWQQKYSLKKLF